MVDLIYNFIVNIFFSNTEIEGANEIAILLTWAVVVALAFVLIRLVVWAFQFIAPRRKARR